MHESTDRVNVGLLGCGTIGSGVFHLARENSESLEQACGCPVEITRILTRDPKEPRPFEADQSIMVTDPEDILKDPSIGIFVEVMGGTEPARTIALEVLESGRHLVTANKELIARHGKELMETASANDAMLMFEASVGGGIPIIRPLESSLGGDRVRKIMGIVNGTTNYILTRMSEEGSTYREALTEAQKLGYAEANPVADVGGADAASKLAILCSIAFKVGISDEQVFREGIQGIRTEDIDNARELGYSVKLLAIASREGERVSARVHPTMIPAAHPLASISGNFNAIFVIGESVGELMFYGQGAGSLPTATAILGDLAHIVRNVGRPPVLRRSYWSRDSSVVPVEDVFTCYYMVLRVVDRPGVLAKIASVFGDNGVSLESVVQKGAGESAEIILITHAVREKALQTARVGLDELDVVLEVPSVVRVEAG